MEYLVFVNATLTIDALNESDARLKVSNELRELNNIDNYDLFLDEM